MHAGPCIEGSVQKAKGFDMSKFLGGLYAETSLKSLQVLVCTLENEEALAVRRGFEKERFWITDISWIRCTELTSYTRSKSRVRRSRAKR